MPELSIIIPTYNRASYLEHLLQNIKEQADGYFGDIELAVSDNASEDNTKDIISEEKRLPIQYNCQPKNLGPVENVLSACEIANGDFCLFISDDDLLCPFALTLVIEYIRKSSDVGVITSSVTLFRDGLPDKSIGREYFPNSARKDILIKKGSNALASVFLRASTFSGLIIRRDLLDLRGARKHAQSLYPQMYLVGYASKKADVAYLKDPLVRIRENTVKFWDYNSDFMANAVLGILKDLTENEPWGDKVYSQLVVKRITAAYGVLYTARSDSMRSFFRVIKGLASVSDYRKKPFFWALALGIGLLGPKGLSLLRRIWKGPRIDTISSQV
jgi:glycosyltransferase involved in cell wall biosynthesis